MAYNMGEGGAAKLWAQGITSSEYSRDIIVARFAPLRCLIRQYQPERYSVRFPAMTQPTSQSMLFK